MLYFSFACKTIKRAGFASLAVSETRILSSELISCEKLNINIHWDINSSCVKMITQVTRMQPSQEELQLPEQLKTCPLKDDFLRKRGLSSCGSFSSGSDSGVESSEFDETTKSLDESLGKKIVTQVEMYLSDENLAKDAFLYKHIKRNKEGYINVKLFGSLRKVKTICKDWKVVATAIKLYSQTLIMNDDGTKVRRVTPFVASSIQSNQNDVKARKVVLVNLPSKQLNVSEVASLFQAVIPVKSVEILKGNTTSLFNDEWFSAVPQLRTSPTAIIEFESEKAAVQAVKHLESNARLNWRQTMKAYLLSSPPSTSVSEVPSKGLLMRQRSRTVDEESPRVMRVSNVSRNKSGSCSSIDLGRRVSSSIHDQKMTILRQPHGPDGTAGFSRWTTRLVDNKFIYVSIILYFDYILWIFCLSNDDDFVQ